MGIKLEPAENKTVDASALIFPSTFWVPKNVNLTFCIKALNS